MTDWRVEKMTDKEKIEKLLDYIVDIGEEFACDSFNDEDGEWCEEHCKWSHAQKSCYRHFLLGE